MSDIFLGHDTATGKEFCIPADAFRTHFHLIGGTGKGKTTAIHTLLHPLLLDHRSKAAFFIIDRMGNLSGELLLWITSKFCTDSVRRRVLYIEPSREDVVLPFNPLLHETEQHGYYKVTRATDIILRAWESVDIEKMPRLARWTFNAFWAAAQLGLTIADCGHFLMPGSPYHTQLLDCLPPLLKAEWAEIHKARGGEAARILESSRNRLKPYFEAPILRRMFGASHSRLDVLRFMREGRIVLINLAPQNRLSPQLGDAIGALVLNEILANARCLPMTERYPTYLFLDEFQNFVGPDMEAALPEVRQLGIRLILSHQSFSQLERGDYDLTSMIFQAQSRMIFGVQGEDADILGRELSSLTYDPKRIKDQVFHTRQRLAGHEIRELKTWSEAQGEAENWGKTVGGSWAWNDNKTKRPGGLDTKGEGTTRGENNQRNDGRSTSLTKTSGTHEVLVPVHEEVSELSSTTFFSGDDWDRVWSKRVRKLKTGEALVRLVNDPKLHHVSVKRSTPGVLGLDAATLMRTFPQAIDRVHAFIEENFRSDCFVTPQVIEAETEQRLRAVLSAPIIVSPSSGEQDSSGAALRRRGNLEEPADKNKSFNE